jgi:putative transposase
MEILGAKDIHVGGIKCLIYGTAGTGKTTLASTLDPEKTLIVSFESGLLSLLDEPGMDKVQFVNVSTLKELNEIYTEFPYYGTRRISEELKNRGILAGRKQVRSAMRYMGIQALYPKPKTTIANKEHAKYPYQLGQFKNDDNQVIIDTPNQVWSTDITYIRLAKGFVYLAAIIDWNTKKILSWKLSNSMDIYLTTSILNEALSLYPKPDIFNTDQGSQYTAKAHIDILVKNDIIISMDGKARSIDNICIERFWRSLKYEDVYLKSYENIKEARIGIGEYIEKYNTKRLHSAIGYKTPNEVYNKAINCINSEIDEVLPLVA